MKRILTINPGSTSTKLVLFEDEREVLRKELAEPESVLKHPFLSEQAPLRLKTVQAFLAQAQIEVSALDMIVTRGGHLNGLHGGAYWVDEHVATMLEYAPRGHHASGLAALIGYYLAKPCGVPVMFYDSPMSLDADGLILQCGLPGCSRALFMHYLNAHEVACEAAEKLGKPYEACDIIVAHMGGGPTVSFFSKGRLIDGVATDEGAMGPERAGAVPSSALIDLCFSGRYTRAEVQKLLIGRGGLCAYLGVKDAREVEKQIAEGNRQARDLYWLMAYQMAKAIGTCSVMNGGSLDLIVLTGGLAHSKMLTDWIRERVAFLAPVEVIPGEKEMLALAKAGLRVLGGKETLARYTWLPKDCSSLEEVKARYGGGKTSSPD